MTIIEKIEKEMVVATNIVMHELQKVKTIAERKTIVFKFNEEQEKYYIHYYPYCHYMRNPENMIFTQFARCPDGNSHVLGQTPINGFIICKKCGQDLCAI